MTNYYMNYKAQILAIAKRTDIDGCGGKKPTLGVACDVFDNNARVALSGAGTFVECGVPRSNKNFWTKARANGMKCSPAQRVKFQKEFANSCRK